MASLPVAIYTLPAQQGDVPQHLRAEYRAGGFSEGVRNWHLARIPRMIIASGTYITCPWCGKEKDARSIQIDHIIPIQQYGRLNMLAYCREQKKKSIRTDFEKQLPILLKALYNDQKNLLLSCMKCNSGAGNTLPNTQGLRDAAARVQHTVLETKLLALIRILGKIRYLPTKKIPGLTISMHDFIMDGANWNTSPRETRQHSRPSGSGVTAEIGTLNLIHNTVVSLLARGRPQWTISADILVPFQPTRVFNNEEGRLCFYCLGLFKK